MTSGNRGTQVGLMPCGCGAAIPVWLIESPALQCWKLTMYHRGETLVEYQIFAENDPLGFVTDVLRASADIIGILYARLRNWDLVKERGLSCDTYWEKPAEVLRDVYANPC